MLKGSKMSLESREKLKLAHMGKPSCKKGIPMSLESRLKMSKVRMGKSPWNKGKNVRLNPNGEFKKGMTPWNKGIAYEQIRGDKHYLWKGGNSNPIIQARKTIEYRLWREAVFARDHWNCQNCGKIGGDMHAHHIKGFREYPELRVALDNGITLCKICHFKIHQYKVDVNVAQAKEKVKSV